MIEVKRWYFAGPGIWEVLALAALAGGLVYWLYRCEVRHIAGYLTWLLPLLRAAAVILIALILSQPTIEAVSRVWKRERILVIVDGSQSMTLVDEHLHCGHKLLVAQALGWISSQALDPKLIEAANQLAQAGNVLRSASRPDRPKLRPAIQTGHKTVRRRNRRTGTCTFR